MSGVNKVILIGNLGADPTVKDWNGGKIVNFSVATSEVWKNKETGQPEEKVEWHKVVAYNKLADICASYLKKGSKVFIEGKMQTRKWKDKQGIEKDTFEIIASTMQMLDGKGSGPTEESAPYKPHGAARETVAEDNAFDDDIPF